MGMMRYLLALYMCIYSVHISAYVLITSLYNEKNPDRIQEYITCLENNLRHPDIDLIHVLYDVTGIKSPLWDQLHTYDRVVIQKIKDRPSFGQCFEIANTLYPDNVVLISNADIYFNETLGLLRGFDLTNKFFALTRWNVTASGGLEPFTVGGGHQFHGSQDVWIFKSPITILPADDIQLGMPHCDIYISYRAMQSGFGVYNPCISIQCCHLHLSNVRNYPSIGGPKPPFGQVPWCRMDQVGDTRYQAYVEHGKKPRRVNAYTVRQSRKVRRH